MFSHRIRHGLNLSVKRVAKGFTLIEMLVALAIGASISVLAYQALSGAINIEERVSEVTEDIEQIDRVWNFFGEDFQHAIARPWQNEFQQQQPALFGLLGDRLAQSSTVSTGNDNYLLRFVRSGRLNILNRPRSDLEIVAYRITLDETKESADGGNIILWRDYWSPIESDSEPTIKSRRLLDNISSISFRYLERESVSTKDEAWLTGWPKSSEVVEELPIAIEVTIELAVLGELKRLFHLVENAN